MTSPRNHDEVYSYAIVDGRQILEITASNGEKFLMYKSKGTGTGAASKGKWVPLPGFAKDGYFIKGAFNPETGKTFIPNLNKDG